MSAQYVQVTDDNETIELPCEENNALLLTTLSAQFPGVCGLKYKNASTDTMRAVRLVDGSFLPPDDDWGDVIYKCVFPKVTEPKSDEVENDTGYTKRRETKRECSDLIVLGLPYKTTDQELRQYFEQFGELLMAEVKKDLFNGQSKGFGFIRFESYESQARVLSKRHMIDGRWCDVKIPNSHGGQEALELNSKVFIGRCTEDITKDDFFEYFSKFGEVTDVYIPKPFRACAFVNFLDAEVAQKLCGEDHIIKGTSVHVSNAVPKNETANFQARRMNFRASGSIMDNYYNSRSANSYAPSGYGRGTAIYHSDYVGYPPRAYNVTGAKRKFTSLDVTDRTSNNNFKYLKPFYQD